MPEVSTKPYLIRALFEWCNDNGYTPYVAVAVADPVQVPAEYVKDGEIVLNVSPLATNRLTIGNEFLEFQARFGGVAREVRVPIAFVRAIYARETGQGMAFEEPPPAGAVVPAESPAAQASTPPALAPVPAPPPPGAASPALRVLSTPEPGEPTPEPPPAAGGSGERPRLTRIK
jgi:stringent starvation protein B